MPVFELSIVAGSKSFLSQLVQCKIVPANSRHSVKHMHCYHALLLQHSLTDPVRQSSDRCVDMQCARFQACDPACVLLLQLGNTHSGNTLACQTAHQSPIYLYKLM